MTTSMPIPRSIVILSDEDLLKAMKEIHEDIKNIPVDGVLQRIAIEEKLVEDGILVSEFDVQELMMYALCFLGEASMRWAKTQETK